MTRIFIAGASGYIGHALIPKLQKRFPDAHITALSRSQQKSEDPRIEWKACDLFSLKQLEAAAPSQIDLAIYLVHSMGPTAQLDQGSFADYDLILADNFARVVKKAAVKQVIYLGGIIPEGEELSLHLQSRREVEQTFRSHDLVTTAFRAGLIMGEGGSSTQILLKLVKRLPVMICPAWTRNLTSPVLLETVLDAICAAALKPEHFHKVYDLEGCRALPYVEMMKQTAEHLNKRRAFLNVPFFSPYLSRLWVSVVTNTPKNLVYPLIESLAHPMVARKDHLFFKDLGTRSFRELIKKVPTKTIAKQSLFKFRPKGRSVRSVQRLPLPPGKNAEWVKNRYVSWLPQFFRSLLKAEIIDDRISFSILGISSPLLELKFNTERSTPDRQLLYLGKGLLISRKNVGRLEFRTVLDKKFVLAAIHDYRPALPWYLYRLSQAKIHLWVMKAFGRELKNFKPRN